ncbi:hypothetical protein [Endothiovibrio diazotrophicus]
MTTVTLPFAKLDFIDQRIVIIEIREGVEELSRKMVSELQQACREHCELPYIAISNKRASYSIAFDAAQEITGIDEVIELISVIPDSATRSTLHWFCKMYPRYQFANTLDQAVDQAHRRLAEWKAETGNR